jgi:hypothetical protein
VASDQPFDHNAECRFCDEQGMHAIDCPWLLGLIAKVDSQEEVIRNQLRNLGELRAAHDALQKDKAALELLVQELIAAAKGPPAGRGI